MIRNTLDKGDESMEGDLLKENASGTDIRMMVLFSKEESVLENARVERPILPTHLRCRWEMEKRRNCQEEILEGRSGKNDGVGRGRIKSGDREVCVKEDPEGVGESCWYFGRFEGIDSEKYVCGGIKGRGTFRERWS